MKLIAFSLYKYIELYGYDAVPKFISPKVVGTKLPATNTSLFPISNVNNVKARLPLTFDDAFVSSCCDILFCANVVSSSVISCVVGSMSPDSKAYDDTSLFISKNPNEKSLVAITNGNDCIDSIAPTFEVTVILYGGFPVIPVIVNELGPPELYLNTPLT